MLSPERRTTASQARTLFLGSAADIYQLWLVRTGQAKPEDLSNVYHVQHGAFLEPFVLDWTERTTQHEITERQRFVPHPSLPGIGGTLDGYRAFDNAVIECKVVNPFRKAETVGSDTGFIDEHRPQLAALIACRGATRGYLLVQQGNAAPVLYEPEITPAFTDAVLEAMVSFELAVVTGTPPVSPPPLPVVPERMRKIDLDRMQTPLPNWAASLIPTLHIWKETRPVWAQHEQAKADVKEFLPDDVSEARYGDIVVKRSRSNAVTVKESA